MSSTYRVSTGPICQFLYVSVFVYLCVCGYVFPVFFSMLLIGLYSRFWQWFCHPTHLTRYFSLTEQYHSIDFFYMTKRWKQHHWLVLSSIKGDHEKYSCSSFFYVCLCTFLCILWQFTKFCSFHTRIKKSDLISIFCWGIEMNWFFSVKLQLSTLVFCPSFDCIDLSKKFDMEALLNQTKSTS